MLLDLTLRWIHVLSAAVLVGGTFFMRFSLLGALDSIEESARDEAAAGVRSRWSKLVMIASGLLLISGLFNVVLIIQQYDFDKSQPAGRLYHMFVGIKFLLALGVFFLSAVLSGRSGLAQRLRQNETRWLNLTLVLAIAVVCLAGVMKLAPRSEKPAESSRRERVEQQVVNSGVLDPTRIVTSESRNSLES